VARLHETAASRLIGRAADLKRAEEALEQARVVTITGTAGVGKTRLAREIARRRAETCLFVDATETRGVEALCAVVARALGLGHRGPSDASIQALGEALAARGRVLVILDNFEHHVALAPATISVWMDEAPDAAFLVTSRERLHVDGELACDLRPLPIPAPSAAPDEIARCEAVQLFVSRARAARAGIEPGPEDHAAIAAIVRRLDGVPLAIELAAARADVLSPAQILARLSRPLELLAAPGRGPPSRSTTLRAAIACSWDLLRDEERSALVECSVFRGGFTLEAAEEVLSRGETAIVDLVQTLVRKSLL
jgi:predicted ATPase